MAFYTTSRALRSGPPSTYLNGVTVVITTINHSYWRCKPPDMYVAKWESTTSILPIIPVTIKSLLVGGWYTYPSEKMMQFVSWDDEIPNWMESHKIHVPNHQIGLKPHDQSGSWPGWWLIKYDSTAYLDQHRERVIFISPISKVATRHIFRPSFDQRRKRHHRAESRKLTSPWSQCQPHVLPWPWPWPDLGVPWNLALDS